MPADCIVMGKTIVSKHIKCLDLVNVISKHFYCLGENADNTLLMEQDKYWNVYRIIFNFICYEPYWIQTLIHWGTLNWIKCLFTVRIRGFRYMVFCDIAKTWKGLNSLAFRLSDLISSDWCHKVQSTVIKQGHVRCTCLCELKKAH